MKISYKTRQNWAGRIGLCLAILLAGLADAKDIHMDVLHFKTGTLSNVTIFTVSQTEIGVSHAGGLTSIKLQDLNPETLRQLGFNSVPQPQQASSGSFQVAARSANGDDAATTDSSNLAKSVKLPIDLSALPKTLLLVTTGVIFAFYLFFCYCLKLIVKKTGFEPGFMVWVPVLQLLPMLQAAGMSGLWFFGFFIPVLNVVAHVLWAVKIVQAREKKGWVTALLIFPITNLIGLAYLAFSSVDDEVERKPSKPVIVPQPLKEAA